MRLIFGAERERLLMPPFLTGLFGPLLDFLPPSEVLVTTSTLLWDLSVCFDVSSFGIYFVY